MVITSGKFYVVSLDQANPVDQNNETEPVNEEGESSSKKSRMDQQLFHTRLRLRFYLL